MPRPFFIICSQSGAEDKATNLVSIFQILEKIRFSDTPQPDAAPLIQMQILAAWIREEEDIGQTFEFETRILLPPEETVFEVGRGEIIFDNEIRKVMAKIFGVLPIMAGGVMKIQNRIRRAGDSDWVTQEYPIIVEKAASPTAAAPQPSSN